jgi:hypothetical protein
MSDQHISAHISGRYVTVLLRVALALWLWTGERSNTRSRQFSGISFLGQANYAVLRFIKKKSLEEIMSVTFLNEGAGGTWIVDAPEGVTVTPTTDSSGIATALHISVDYDYNDFTDPKTGSILGINFLGPTTDPTGHAQPSQAYPGLRIPTTIDIENDLGVPINGYSFFETNLGLSSTNFPQDFANPHPDDYAHFHGLTTTSLIDKATGTPNATLTLYDPNFAPGAFGQAGASPGVPAPNFISASGTILPGATEELVGNNPGGTFTVHSEDTPGPTGGSFVLAFFPQDTIGAPNPTW